MGRGMDLTALVFYAVICGLLSAVAPVFVTLPVRLLTGAAVGVAAAAALPLVQGAVGY